MPSDGYGMVMLLMVVSSHTKEVPDRTKNLDEVGPLPPWSKPQIWRGLMAVNYSGVGKGRAMHYWVLPRKGWPRFVQDMGRTHM